MFRHVGSSSTRLLVIKPSRSIRTSQFQRSLFKSSGIAARAMSDMTQVFTEDSLPPIGHYSQAIKANGLVWLSGQLPATRDGKLVEGSITEKAHQALRNTKAVLKAAGSDLEKVVKVTVFFENLGDAPEFNTVYAKYFPQKPARSSAQSNSLPLAAAFEMDIVALA